MPSLATLINIIFIIASSASVLLYIQISANFKELQKEVHKSCHQSDAESTPYDDIRIDTRTREEDERIITTNQNLVQKQLDSKRQHTFIDEESMLPMQQHARQITEVTPAASSKTRYLTVKGAVGDGVTDDTEAIQKALNKAAKNKSNGVVILKKGIYLTTKTLKIKGGVTLRGQGYGSSPLAIQFDAGGSVIAYCGESYAVKIVGHAASLESLAVYDWRYPEDSECDNVKAAGGVLISADGRLVESVIMKNVLIYWFMGGTALTLEAKNSGGIAFASIENIRIRHAKVGIHLLSADEMSVVNSNRFHDGGMNGAITDVGVLAEGPGACNDNQFQGMFIEPPSTNIAHVYVSGSKTNVQLIYVRLEGTEMLALQRPLIIVEDNSYGNVMNGMLGHTNVQADFNKNPGITFATNKMVGLQPAANNMFWNAAFHGLDVSGQSVPGWVVSGSNFHLDLSLTEELLYPDHNIINITKDDETVFKLRPEHPPRSHIHSFCTFGIYAKSTTPNSISAAMKYRSGSTIASSGHSGSGNWEFVGMSSEFAQSTGPLAYFSITGSVELSAPTFTYGQGPATPGSEFMSSSGARMSGLLSMNLIDVSAPKTEDGGHWVLPREGNVFDISPIPPTDEPCTTSYMYVSRINYRGIDRFTAGSIITLLFPACGECTPCLGLKNGGYIKLLGENDFFPVAVQSSITLITKGTGSWSEISRNTL
eukprot:CAMPEP_0194367524 /NCGR_PEP_ID=MMETSP0174-20130528/15615_1 /TAXON_ID=216777 /ORGANISM="Proboscia alata, Strain PI-D3" /LENGTH=708 /DNA_ID=CAMNT_0039143321 /DNA_START=193 /DNA_END=2319 /DNA_ORIENTATION=-